jgi:hypothetical protein
MEAAKRQEHANEGKYPREATAACIHITTHTQIQEQQSATIARKITTSIGIQHGSSKETRTRKRREIEITAATTVGLDSTPVELYSRLQNNTIRHTNAQHSNDGQQADRQISNDRLTKRHRNNRGTGKHSSSSSSTMDEHIVSAMIKHACSNEAKRKHKRMEANTSKLYSGKQNADRFKSPDRSDQIRALGRDRTDYLRTQETAQQNLQ